MVHTINRVTKQIVAAVLVTGLLVGSILLIINEIGPKWKGYSAFGSIGVLLAIIVVAGMIRDIWKGDYGDYEGFKNPE
jgi:hypothetical protein